MGIWSRFYEDEGSYEIYTKGKPIKISTGNYYIRHCSFCRSSNRSISFDNTFDYKTLVSDCIFCDLSGPLQAMVLQQFKGQCVMYHICCTNLSTTIEAQSISRLDLINNTDNKNYFLESSISNSKSHFEPFRHDYGEVIISFLNTSNAATIQTNSIFAICADVLHNATIDYINAFNCSTTGAGGIGCFHEYTITENCIFRNISTKNGGLFELKFSAKSNQIRKCIIQSCSYPYLLYAEVGTIDMKECLMNDASSTNSYGNCAFSSTNSIIFSSTFLEKISCEIIEITITEPIEYNYLCLVDAIFIAVCLD